MKKLAKRIAALAMTAAMMTASAGAITQDGQSETWFDGVWALIDAFGLKAEHDPYVLQNYINKYLEKHPDEMYDVLNDILSLLDTHSMYLSSEEYSQGFSTLEGFVGIGVGLTPDIQLENRKVTVNTKNLKPLDTSTTLRFGDSSDAVYAMTERLSLLGLLTEATGRYDGDVADAVASFRAAYDLPAALYASPEMLSALDEAVTALNGQTYLVDDQLQSALEMCRLAAAKPQQYTVKSDGSWTKK